MILQALSLLAAFPVGLGTPFVTPSPNSSFLAQSSQSAGYEDTFAIVDAKIEIGNGLTIEKGNVIVRGGQIIAVGANVPVPTYAIVIKEPGAIVYPGFIDAYSSLGVALPEAKPDQDTPPNFSDTPPASMRSGNRKGIRPDFDAAANYLLTAEQTVAERRAGFTNAFLSATGGYVNGPGALVNLATAPRRESVLALGGNLSFGYRAAGTGYPTSLMGSIANLRQLFLDANYWRANKDVDDPVLRALEPVMEGKASAFFEVESENEIVRALRFEKDFNLNMTLVGAGEAFKQTPMLKGMVSNVIASINFGLRPIVPEEGKETIGAAPRAYQQERLVLYRDRVSNLATLNRNGLGIMLTSRGLRTKQEFFANLRRAVEAGFPREEALKSLTSRPAKFFGVDSKIGTVEVGKKSNITVFSGDFLDEKSRVIHVFLGDRHYRPSTDVPRVNAPVLEEEEDLCCAGGFHKLGEGHSHSNGIGGRK